MEKVFLTKEEIKTITDLQTKEEKFISQLGALEYQLQILLRQKKELDNLIDPLQIDKEKFNLWNSNTWFFPVVLTNCCTQLSLPLYDR